MSEKPRSPGGVQVRFNGISHGEEKPTIAIYSLGADGRPESKLAVLEGDRLNIPRDVAKPEAVVAIGPNVQDPKKLPSELVVNYRGDQLSQALNAGVLEIPKGIWSGWHLFNVCVSGKAEKCSLILWKSINLVNPKFRPPIFPRCAPICNGIVEIYEKLCCCRWWIDPIDLSGLLARLKYLVAVQPPIPHPGPGPDPWEAVALRNEIDLMRATASPASLSGITSLPLAREAPLGAPHFDAQAEILRIQSMPQEEAMKYVRETEYLRPYFCFCSSRKVGEAVLSPDGTFSYCYFRPPILSPLGISCSYSYSYKVKQWDGSAWVYIYDGVALGQSFPQDQNAVLETFSGIACDPGPVIDHDGPYVMLENIGDTQSWNLVSQTQTAEMGLAAVADNGGLVFPPAPLTSDLGVMKNCPWGSTLSFRLRFHPFITAPGPTGAGAMYYRISIVPTNDGSTPSGPPKILKNPIAWSYFQLVAGKWTVLTTNLGPNTVGVQDGLYLIPDPGTDWEWYQFHNYWDTTSVPNGRYFVVVEIFDAAGTRLKPTGSPGVGTAANFVFLKWEDATTLSDVNFADLVHLFWVDNIPTYAHIQDLRMNGNPNMAECQYLVGACGDTFSTGFRAFHATRNSGSQPETFMLSYDIWWTRGLGGGSGTIETGDTNKPPTLGGGSPAVSNAIDFCTMLGITPGQHKKCTFALNLYVWAKHWNGGGRLSGYDRSDQASFSLEV